MLKLQRWSSSLRLVRSSSSVIHGLAAPATCVPSTLPRFLGVRTCCASSPALFSSSSKMEELFQSFRTELDANNGIREKLRAAISDLDGAIRSVHAALLPVYHSASVDESIQRAKGCLPEIIKCYAQLKDIVKRQDEYYRFHDFWRTQTESVVASLAFMHWLETGNLLSHKEAEAMLELKPEEFFLDLDDYLIGLCHMCNDLPRYVVNQVIAGNYACPKRVHEFLTELYAAFRLLNLRNDNLRRRFDGIKYDVKKVEEVLYDVQIRGLTSTTAAS